MRERGDLQQHFPILGKKGEDRETRQGKEIIYLTKTKKRKMGGVGKHLNETGVETTFLLGIPFDKKARDDRGKGW